MQLMFLKAVTQSIENDCSLSKSEHIHTFAYLFANSDVKN